MGCPDIALQLFGEPICKELVVDEWETEDIGQENYSNLLVWAFVEICTVDHGAFRFTAHNITLDTLFAAHTGCCGMEVGVEGARGRMKRRCVFNLKRIVPVY